MPNFIIRSCRGHILLRDAGSDFSNVLNIADGVAKIEALLLAATVAADAESTYSLEDEHGNLIASVTNRRMTGVFLKQTWGGLKNDTALPVGEVKFDATDAVLLMDYEELVEMSDDSEISDSLGQKHVSWAGPCRVTVMDSICAYFGISDIRDLTPKAFEFARARANPEPAEEAMLTLTIAVKVRVSSGLRVEDFVSDMDYQILSNTPGITVLDTEVVGSSSNLED